MKVDIFAIVIVVTLAILTVVILYQSTLKPSSIDFFNRCTEAMECTSMEEDTPEYSRCIRQCIDFVWEDM